MKQSFIGSCVTKQSLVTRTGLNGSGLSGLGNSMQLGNLNYLLFLLVIPILIIFYYRSFKIKDRFIKLFISSKLTDLLIPTEVRSRQKSKAILLVIAIIFIIIALSQPRLGFKWEEVKREGMDIIIAIDVSSSMLAKDVEPNRLERAKRKINDLLHMLDGDRVGLVAFAGTSFVQCPLTLDYNAVEMFLDYIDTDLIPIPGTAISDAIKTGIKSFNKNSKNNSKAIILITDGEDHEDDPLEAAKEAKEAGVRIFAIGIGKEGGVPIPGADGNYKKDKNGDLILTKIDELMLQKIALETGGSYVRSVTGDLDLEQIYFNNIKKSLEKTEFQSTKRKRWEERFQWFIFIAILLLVIEFIINEKGRLIDIKTNLKIWKKSRLIIFIILSILINRSLSYAESAYSKAKNGTALYNSGKYDDALNKFNDSLVDKPDNSELKYNLGNTYHKLKNYENADKEYVDALNLTKDSKLKEEIFYNLGNNNFRQGKLNDAVDYYKKALELKPDDMDAKYNLEYAQKEIERRKEEQKKNKDKKDENKEDKNKSEKNKDEQKSDKQDKSKEGDKKGQDKDDGQKNQSKDKNEDKQAADNSAKQTNDKTSDKGSAAQPANKMTKEEANILLDSLREERGNILNKQKLDKAKTRGIDKDW